MTTVLFALDESDSAHLAALTATVAFGPGGVSCSKVIDDQRVVGQPPMVK